MAKIDLTVYPDRSRIKDLVYMTITHNPPLNNCSGTDFPGPKILTLLRLGLLGLLGLPVSRFKAARDLIHLGPDAIQRFCNFLP